ncbi:MULTISPECIES: MBL fold metallo-hydrolase [unclassified Gemella]|uniref:MBL fold metallo-hydrolase n=1 Tax=unclassified Gemella TaxID=2624949 RepID=UPI001C043AE5|nr:MULTISPECIES: MBL fold metallo-hydrolase [unclassified Gemella]MBU0278105.1 MBL fold metallo-hydrolase [Gemella sp. zg-1178]QWQ38369.1 MBL fold metallo-hydrolase [Gemella sp. zg-570]
MLYKISDNVYYSKHRFTYLEPAIGYVKGDKYSIMIDAGNSKEQIERFYEDLKSNNLPLPIYTVLTHHHWDHSFGATYINNTIISSKKTKSYLEEMSKWNWDYKSIDYRVEQNLETEFSANVMKKVYANKKIQIKIPDIAKISDFTINLGDNVVYFYANDNSHSDDALLIYVKKDRVLFLGDSHSKSYKTKPMSFDKIKLFNYIEFISQLDFEYAVPGHGNLYTKNKLIEELEKEYNNII